MCGRFSLRVEMDELIAYYGLARIEYDYAPRFNIAPGQMIPAIIEARGVRMLGPLRWGLVPSWAKDDKIGYMMINARAETIIDKPAFRKPLATKRCVIPADGFYEWRKADKQPFRITMKDESLISLAALYDTWITPAGEKLSTCTVITTEPNELMGTIHDRMPAILPRENVSAWLDKGNHDPNSLLSLLTSYPADHMRAYPVSPVVGSVKNDIPECIAPYISPQTGAGATEQLELF